MPDRCPTECAVVKRVPESADAIRVNATILPDGVNVFPVTVHGLREAVKAFLTDVSGHFGSVNVFWAAADRQSECAIVFQGAAKVHRVIADAFRSGS